VLFTNRKLHTGFRTIVKLESLRWFSQRRSRTQVLCARCVRCDISSDRIALFTFCVVMIQQNATFLRVAHAGGGYDPQIRTRPRFLYKCTYPPSFIILCLLVRKLSCWHTNPQTNRRRRKYPTFFAKLPVYDVA